MKRWTRYLILLLALLAIGWPSIATAQGSSVVVIHLRDRDDTPVVGLPIQFFDEWGRERLGEATSDTEGVIRWVVPTFYSEPRIGLAIDGLAVTSLAETSDRPALLLVFLALSGEQRLDLVQDTDGRWFIDPLTIPSDLPSSGRAAIEALPTVPTIEEVAMGEPTTGMAMTTTRPAAPAAPAAATRSIPLWLVVVGVVAIIGGGWWGYTRSQGGRW